MHAIPSDDILATTWTTEFAGCKDLSIARHHVVNGVVVVRHVINLGAHPDAIVNQVRAIAHGMERNDAAGFEPSSFNARGVLLRHSAQAPGDAAPPRGWRGGVGCR